MLVILSCPLRGRERIRKRVVARVRTMEGIPDGNWW